MRGDGIQLVDVRVAVAAASLLTRYWWSARRGASPQSLAARLDTGTWRIIPPAMESSRVVAIVSRVARLHPLRPTCLPQALTACHLLLSAGRPATVRLGVERDGRGLRAHAWVHTADLLAHEQHGGFLPLGDLPADHHRS